MKFNNSNNRITIRGVVTSDISESSNSISFDIKVIRPSSGVKQAYDIFTVYINDIEKIRNCKANVVKGVALQVKGEMRKFYDDKWRLCVDTIAPIW